MQLIQRKSTVAVSVGHIVIGGGNPVVVQSMTNTETANVVATAQQIESLVAAGSELVRITVDTEAAAAAALAGVCSSSSANAAATSRPPR